VEVQVCRLHRLTWTQVVKLSPVCYVMAIQDVGKIQLGVTGTVTLTPTEPGTTVADLIKHAVPLLETISNGTSLKLE